MMRSAVHKSIQKTIICVHHNNDKTNNDYTRGFGVITTMNEINPDHHSTPMYKENLFVKIRNM